MNEVQITINNDEYFIYYSTNYDKWICFLGPRMQVIEDTLEEATIELYNWLFSEPIEPPYELLQA